MKPGTMEASAAITLGFLSDGRAIARNDYALARFVKLMWDEAKQDRCGAVDAIIERLRRLMDKNDRLPAGARAKIQKQVAERIMRDLRQPAREPTLEERWMSRRGKLCKKIGDELHRLLVHCEYRMPSNRWAGGRSEYRVIIQKTTPSVNRVSWKVWNGRWSGYNTATTVHIPSPSDWLKRASKVCVIRGRRHVVLGATEHNIFYIKPGAGFDLSVVAHPNKPHVQWE